jgi:hypothetical protein
MGLDVYLYRYENFKEMQALKEETQRHLEAMQLKTLAGRSWEELRDSEKELIRQEERKYCLSVGLDEDGDFYSQSEAIDQPSALYPNHLFRRGYFRSSYNSGGFNSIMTVHKLPTLYEIFKASDQYVFLPDWEQARRLSKKAIPKFAKALEDEPLQVMRVRAGIPVSGTSRPRDEQEALKLYKEFAKGWPVRTKATEMFTRSEGLFVKGGSMKVRSLIYGKEMSYLYPGVTQEVIYVIYEDEEGFSFYKQALEIILETCEWVLAQEDPSQYYLHWSS